MIDIVSHTNSIPIETVAVVLEEGINLWWNRGILNKSTTRGGELYPCSRDIVWRIHEYGIGYYCWITTRFTVSPYTESGRKVELMRIHGIVMGDCPNLGNVLNWNYFPYNNGIAVNLYNALDDVGKNNAACYVSCDNWVRGFKNGATLVP